VFVVTTAVMLPTEVGLVLSVTVSEVEVAEVTVPAAPLLSVTVLLDAVVSKPKPVMVKDVALAARLVVVLVTTGMTEATCIDEVLDTPLDDTTAVRLPAFGFVENDTVNEVAVDAVTVPTAPLLKVTTLLPGVVLKFVPAIVMVAALAASVDVLLVTVGTETAVTICATCTADPLVRVLVVTTAVKLPTDVGLTENVIDSELAVAADTVPTAPLLKVTVLFDATGLKP
jgi:hypothetical protein